MDKEEIKDEETNIAALKPELKEELLKIGLNKDEIQILEAWRFVRSRGKFIIFKRQGVLSGQIKINMSH